MLRSLESAMDMTFLSSSPNWQFNYSICLQCLLYSIGCRSTEHGGVQSRLDLHRHQLLQKKLASVRDLDLTDVLSRVAPSAVVLELKQVRLAEKTAPIANMHTVTI